MRRPRSRMFQRTIQQIDSSVIIQQKNSINCRRGTARRREYATFHGSLTESIPMLTLDYRTIYIQVFKKGGVFLKHGVACETVASCCLQE